MPKPPSDWSQDQKLWELLSRTPVQQPPPDFVIQIRQKTQKLQTIPERTSFIRSIFSVFFNGPALVGLVVVCFMAMAVAWVASPLPKKIIKAHPVQQATALPIQATADLPEIVQKYELIQDLEVIQSLDVLMKTDS